MVEPNDFKMHLVLPQACDISSLAGAVVTYIATYPDSFPIVGGTGPTGAFGVNTELSIHDLTVSNNITAYYIQVQTITGYLGSFNELLTDDIQSTDATILNLNVTNIDIGSDISAINGNFTNFTVGSLTGTSIVVSELYASNLTGDNSSFNTSEIISLNAGGIVTNYLEANQLVVTDLVASNFTGTLAQITSLISSDIISSDITVNNLTASIGYITSLGSNDLTTVDLVNTNFTGINMAVVSYTGNYMHLD
jgi:hypothetical protein